MAEELERLAALRAKGSLTDAEYDELKKQVLEGVLTHDSATDSVVGESTVSAEEEPEPLHGGDQPLVFCEQCGSSVNETARFCGSCGQPLVQFAGSADGGSATQPPGKEPSSPRRPLTDTIGRGVGDTIGYSIRGATGTTLEPAKKAWGEREELPKWQNIVGTIGLAVNFFSVVGIAFILLIYFVQVVSGGKGPGQAFRGVIKGCAWLLIVQIPIVLIVVAVALGSG